MDKTGTSTGVPLVKIIERTKFGMASTRTTPGTISALNNQIRLRVNVASFDKKVQKPQPLMPQSMLHLPATLLNIPCFNFLQ